MKSKEKKHTHPESRPPRKPEKKTEPGGRQDLPEEEAEEARQNREKMLRTLAEMENLRKRLDKEKKDYVNYANQELVSDLIPVLDNFDRALSSSDRDPGAASYLEGVKMIYNQLREVLGRQGLEEIKARGEHFDPFFHEAVQQEETGDCPDGTVMEVLLKGYLFRGRLIRPAAVKVSSHPEEGSEEDDPASSGG